MQQPAKETFSKKASEDKQENEQLPLTLICASPRSSSSGHWPMGASRMRRTPSACPAPASWQSPSSRSRDSHAPFGVPASCLPAPRPSSGACLLGDPAKEKTSGGATVAWARKLSCPDGCAHGAPHTALSGKGSCGWGRGGNTKTPGGSDYSEEKKNRRKSSLRGSED